MSFQTAQHSNANAIQTSILLDILGKKGSKLPKEQEPTVSNAREKAELVRIWIELEHLKRELRGIPRLKPAEVGSLLKNAKRAMTSYEPIEVADVPTAEAEVSQESPE